MFWKSKKAAADIQPEPRFTYEEAKQATRSAAFLNVAHGMTDDKEYKQQLRLLFQTCRTAALTAGVAAGHSEAEIDGAISGLCDTDTCNMQTASDDDFRQFVGKCGQTVKDFLDKM